MTNICFLTYVQRSGSTFLAAQLDKYKVVGTSLSANLPGDLVASDKLPVKSETEIESLVEKLFEDVKFKSWGISEHLLTTALRNETFPLHFPRLLKLILTLYFNRVKPSAQVFVYKKGNYIHRLDTLKQIFPDAKFIYIYRDPRGVYNSQRHSRGSTSNQPFATNPVSFCKEWERAMQIAKSQESNPRFISVKYENLASDPENVMRHMSDFLEIEDTMTEDTNGYYDMIPDTQRHLHRLVQGPPRKDRINAWQSSLSSAEIWMIERHARSLVDLGYRPLNIEPDGMIYRQYLQYWSSYHVGRVSLRRLKSVPRSLIQRVHKGLRGKH